MRPVPITTLLGERTLDARLAALVWLLVEGGVPLVVAGPAPTTSRAGLATALLTLDPAREWVLVDADDQPLDTARLAALLRGGVGLGVTLDAPDLPGVLARFRDMGLPEDGIRRLGVVTILAATAAGLRCTSVHYLRPSERDGQGHVQRRPPAVLAAWDEIGDAQEDFGWGITPELADRVDRAQADLEERQVDRARLLLALAHEGVGEATTERVHAYLATEPDRVPAPAREPVEGSPFKGGLLDHDGHPHDGHGP